MQRLRQQQAQAGAQQGEHAQNDLRQRREHCPRVQNVCTEECERIAHDMHGSHSLATHTCWYQLRGVLGGRVVGHGDTEAPNHGKRYHYCGVCGRVYEKML